VKRSDNENATYGASCLPEDSRKRMDDLDYGAKAVDQVAILVPIFFER
jgi:hypothetical protein